ncbi:uncharacterized protein LOC122393052 [Amphibalanus amphitrite]|uniref:uncharacterized protein LOC122393052 n=1 Tax=Amphibalanus amphitrite TaxID=1232801 RepID=UPI001C91D002|nr:uncharacterized protein LOC122393052 [Amphibalanus amphitrite]
MVARWIVLLAVALASVSAEQGPRQQLLQRLPDLSWSRLSALERLVETSGHLSTEELLRRTGTLELYQALPEADGQLDRLNLLIGLLIGPYITPLAAFREISPLCRQHSWQYVTNILGINNTWALMMFDSVGKLPDGIFAGNTNPVGIWDECLNVEAVIDGICEEDHMFKGKYCRPEFGLLTNASEDGQVQHSLAELHNWSPDPSGLGIEPILPPLIHVSGHTVLSQLIVSVGLCIPSSCSADELRLGLEKKMPGVAVTLPDGNCHVLDQETTFTGGDIAVMTILCVVGLLMIVGTFIDVVKESAAEDGATVSVVVDSKFRARMPSTLQKVFLAFSVWTNGRKLLDTSSSTFVSTLYRHIGNGPFWSNIAENGTPEVCSEYWWRNLLYVNNLFDPQELCLGQTWYLANDMQMFIASPIVLLPLFFYPILGQIWLMFLIALNVFVTGYVTAYNDLGPQDNGNNATQLRYFMPYCRYGAYLVGVYTGYFLHVRRRWPLELSLPAVLAGWTVSALTACCIVYGMYEYSTVPALAVPSRSVAIIYGSMNRPVWAMCLAWVVIACVHGYGGFINTLLSWKFWIPLSRVTYCCYLVSIDTQVFFYATLKSVLYFDQTNAVYQFLATLCIAVAVATVFSLAFESPMLALEKIIFANVGTGAPKKKPVEPEPVASKPELETELADGSPQEEVENNSS